MSGKNYLEHRFVSYTDTIKGTKRFRLECKKSDKWELVDDDIIRYYTLHDRLFYKKYDKKGEVWWMCEVSVMKPECLGERYFEGSFFCMHNFWVSFFTQDGVFKRIVYDNYVSVDYDKRLLFCRKDGKYDVYRIEGFLGFEASGYLMLRFGSPTEILRFKTFDGKIMYLRSRLNPDKTSYWQEVDVRPWYTKMYQRIRKALA